MAISFCQFTSDYWLGGGDRGSNNGSPRYYPKRWNLRFDLHAMLRVVVVAGTGAKFAFDDFDLAELIEIQAAPGACDRESLGAFASDLKEERVFAISFPSERMRTQLAPLVVIDGRDRLLLGNGLLDQFKGI